MKIHLMSKLIPVSCVKLYIEEILYVVISVNSGIVSRVLALQRLR